MTSNIINPKCTHTHTQIICRLLMAKSSANLGNSERASSKQKKNPINSNH